MTYHHDCTNENAEEGKTFCAQSEPIDVDENNDERLEPDVQDAVDQGNVEVEEEHHLR